ncbi:MAG: glycosyltransferase, partial [Cyanobacteria bacterium J06635_15]
IEPRPRLDTPMHAIFSDYQLIEKTHYPPLGGEGKLGRVLNLVGQFLDNLHRGSLACLAMVDIWQPRYSLVLLRKALSLLHRPQYDIIHAQFGYEGIASLKLWQLGLLQGKLITTFRGHDITGFLQDRKLLNPYQALFSNGHYFLTNSHFFRQRVIELGCPMDKVEVLYSGIDCHHFAYRTPVFEPGKPIQVVTIGRLVEKKGIAYCIHAVARLIQQGKQLRYMIIGEGPLRADLTQLIQSLGMEDAILMLGAKHQSEILEILNASHLFVAASTTAADGDQDGPVNTLKEAMAVGLPVIGTDHGGIPELIEAGVSGFLVPEKDIDAIANKIEYLIHHPEIWPGISRAARQRVEAKYGINKVSDDLEDFYHQVLGKHELVKV